MTESPGDESANARDRSHAITYGVAAVLVLSIICTYLKPPAWLTPFLPIVAPIVQITALVAGPALIALAFVLWRVSPRANRALAVVLIVIACVWIGSLVFLVALMASGVD